MSRIACKNCGTEITGSGSILFCSCGAKSDAAAAEPSRGLPGTELKRIIPGYLGKADCQTCKDYARTMDRWGVDGCEQRFDRIVGRLMSVANESRILRLFPNVTESVCRDWVRRAIDNARAAAQTAPGKFSAVWVYWAGGAAGDELRYSIRSACKNLGDLKNVVICGDHPRRLVHRRFHPFAAIQREASQTRPQDGPLGEATRLGAEAATHHR